MTVLTARLPASAATMLDMELVRHVLLFVAAACLVASPFVRDPLALAVGGAVPWMVAAILAKPEIPGIVFYFLMTHWLQVVARLAISWSDNESLSDSLWGPDLAKAYWYSLASIGVLSLGVRLGFSGMREAPMDAANEVQRWRLNRLLILYFVALALSLLTSRVAPSAGGLAQPLLALSAVRQSALFLFFVSALSSNTGPKWIAIVMIVEIAIGFAGIFADFKTCFVVLAVAVLAVRPVLRPSTIVLLATSALMFIGLLLFWTGVKGEYRQLSTGYSNTQQVSVPLEERMGWLVQKVLSPGDMNWAENADQLVRRIAYIDFFAGTISATQASADGRTFGNWSDMFKHILRPRLLFPDKEIVDDSAVYERLTHADAGEERFGTSISVGYLAENFADFGFPMMLAPLFVLGVFVALSVRYFLTRPMERLAGEACAVAVVLSCSYGTSATLTKFVAPVILHVVFFALIAKFVWPSLARWLR